MGADEAISYVHVCTKCIARVELITGNHDDDLIERKKKIVCTVQPMGHQTKNGKVKTIKDFTVEQKKHAFCPEATTQLGLWVDQNITLTTANF